MIIGHHHSQSKFRSNKDSSNKRFDGTADLLGFGSLVTAASAIEVGSRKEGKTKRLSASKEALLMLCGAQAEKSGVMRISWIRTVAAR